MKCEDFLQGFLKICVLLAVNAAWLAGWVEGTKTSEEKAYCLSGWNSCNPHTWIERICSSSLLRDRGQVPLAMEVSPKVQAVPQPLARTSGQVYWCRDRIAGGSNTALSCFSTHWLPSLCTSPVQNNEQNEYMFGEYLGVCNMLLHL